MGNVGIERISFIISLGYHSAGFLYRAKRYGITFRESWNTGKVHIVYFVSFVAPPYPTRKISQKSEKCRDKETGGRRGNANGGADVDYGSGGRGCIIRIGNPNASEPWFESMIKLRPCPIGSKRWIESGRSLAFRPSGKRKAWLQGKGSVEFFHPLGRQELSPIRDLSDGEATAAHHFHNCNPHAVPYHFIPLNGNSFHRELRSTSLASVTVNL